MSSNNFYSSQDAARIKVVKRARMEDVQEQYDEETSSSNYGRRRLSSNDDEDDVDDVEANVVAPPEPKRAKTNEGIGAQLLAKMGYKEGKGLGARGQGIVEPVALSTQRGRVGLGHESSKALARDFDAIWDPSAEEKTVEEHVIWMPAPTEEDREKYLNLVKEKGSSWWVEGKPKLIIDDETRFCTPSVLRDMLQAKTVFDNLSDRELREARTRANPYETIGGAFFQNRAAMKTANLDRVFDWMFTREENEKHRLAKNPVEEGNETRNADRNESMFYFADVCAGPGGFSEYTLWRKGFYNAKGFGFTLRGKDDFKLFKFTAASPCFFETYYGPDNDGDVMKPANIDALEKFVKKGTNDIGVHLMMADGGFSVEGQENIQEILSKRLYLCQLLVSLCIVRDGGNFFCKLFDVFTPFSVALVFLMRLAYDEVSLHKPHTSRPANSERYIICRGLRQEAANVVKEFLKSLNRKLDVLAKTDKQKDIVECIPEEILKEDDNFLSYIQQHNDALAKRQTLYLKKYLSFAKNAGQFDSDQADLRERCLRYWAIPTKRTRPRDARDSPQSVLQKYSPERVPDEIFTRRPPPFTMDLLKPSEKRIPYREFRMNLLTERSVPPKLMIATGNKVWWYENMWQPVSGNFRLPNNTIVLAEVATPFRIDGKKLVKGATNDVLRIFDAALLAGDDVSTLPYEERMKATEKLCSAVSLVQPNTVDNRGNSQHYACVVAVKTFELEDVASMRRIFKRMLHNGEELVVFEEDGKTFPCRGIRVSRYLAEHCVMMWSKSQSREFAFNKTNGSTVYSDRFVSDNCLSTFWESFLRQSKMQWIWSWVARVDQTGYGPRVILEEASNVCGPTIESIRHAIEEADRSAHKTSS